MSVADTVVFVSVGCEVCACAIVADSGASNTMCPLSFDVVVRPPV